MRKPKITARILTYMFIIGAVVLFMSASISDMVDAPKNITIGLMSAFMVSFAVGLILAPFTYDDID